MPPPPEDHLEYHGDDPTDHLLPGDPLGLQEIDARIAEAHAPVVDIDAVLKQEHDAAMDVIDSPDDGDDRLPEYGELGVVD